MKDRIGITGSSGSLGKIIKKNYKKKYNFFYFKGDITKKENLEKWFNKNDLNVIIHLAAIVPIKDVNKNKILAKKVNYIGTKNLVDICVKKKINWFFFSSTSHVYSSSKKKISENASRKPISYYGKTKLMSENYIIKNFEKKNIRYCIGRIFSTANKNQKKNYLVPDLFKRIRKANKTISFYNLNHYRDFISMEKISKILFFLYKKKYKGKINIASGKSVYLKDIAKLICEKYNKKFRFVDNKKTTYLIADVSKLKSLFKYNLSNKIKSIIF